MHAISHADTLVHAFLLDIRFDVISTKNDTCLRRSLVTRPHFMFNRPGVLFELAQTEREVRSLGKSWHLPLVLKVVTRAIGSGLGT